MSFTRTKDRIWAAFDIPAAWLAHRPAPVRQIGYGIFGVVLWTAYLLPFNFIRPTIAALAHKTGGTPFSLFRRFVKGFVRGVDRVEQVRHGFTDKVDAMLRISDEARLDDMLRAGGVVIVIPHTHSSLAMGRGLAQRHPLLAIVRSTRNPSRGASERQIYENMGCDYTDIGLESPGVVARKVLRALDQKRIVVGTVDRIRKPPAGDRAVDIKQDLVRAHAFGEPIGVAGWPARFAFRASVPIVPATVVQSADTISLVLGTAIEPSDDVSATTQAWVDELETLLRAHPDEWVFALDMQWSRVLLGTSAD